MYRYSRDRWTALCLLLLCWLLFGALEQRPFKLQGAVLEALVERGRLHFVRGKMDGEVFENLDTNAPSFRYLFNVFPHEGRYHVNHAPGQFLLAAPWYALCVGLGWRFESHDGLVWRILVWTLTAPLGALGVASLFLLARQWEMSWNAALLVSMTFAVASPWWAASGVLYHDTLGIALFLVGATFWQYRFTPRKFPVCVTSLVSGLLLAYSVVTTYLLLPVVLIACVFVLASRPRRPDLIFFALGFLPTLGVLPVANLIAFGSSLVTGYSAGGFYENYPSLLDLSNAWEKAGFYLWNWEYGLLWLYPVFLIGAVGLFFLRSATPPVKKMLLTLAAVHFLFILSMVHHGSVGWGMGRFFLPLYPILALGLAVVLDLEGWNGDVARTLGFTALFYSAGFALTGALYGVQGVMEPGVPSLKLRLIVDHYEIYQGLTWLALISGFIAALLYRSFSAGQSVASKHLELQSRERSSRRSKVDRTVRTRERRRRK